MKTSNRQKLLLVVTIAVAALFLGDRLVLTPLTNLWKKRSQEIARLRESVQYGSDLIKREQTVRSRWNQMRTNTLPNNPSLSQEQLLNSLENWSHESSISLNGVTPQRRADSDQYETLICRVDASGTLWALTRFLYDIESAPLALKIDSIDLSSKDNTGQQLTLGLQVSGLVLTGKGK